MPLARKTRSIHNSKLDNLTRVSDYTRAQYERCSKITRTSIRLFMAKRANIFLLSMRLNPVCKCWLLSSTFSCILSYCQSSLLLSSTVFFLPTFLSVQVFLSSFLRTTLSHELGFTSLSHLLDCWTVIVGNISRRERRSRYMFLRLGPTFK